MAIVAMLDAGTRCYRLKWLAVKGGRGGAMELLLQQRQLSSLVLLFFSLLASPSLIDSASRESERSKGGAIPADVSNFNIHTRNVRRYPLLIIVLPLHTQTCLYPFANQPVL